MRRVLPAILAVLFLAGCGQSEDRAAVRRVTDRFLTAEKAKQGAAACGVLSSDTRKSLERQESKPCPQAIGSVNVAGGPVLKIQVAITSAKVNTVLNAFTRLNGMRDAGIQSLGTSTTAATPADERLLYVCASGTGATATDCGSAGNTLSNGDTVFIVYSLGKNAATTGVSGAASVDEQVNLNGPSVFVSRVTSNQTGSEFDDIVLYSSRSSIISQMTVAGQLP